MPRKGRGSDTGSENQELVGTFETLRDEGEHFVHVKNYAKAIESFTRALDMNPGDRNCLVTRSKCWLQLGNAENSLTDAEEALVEDKNFIRGLLQKAEAMYQLGDFETALVFFHRGHKERPEYQEFRLGIQKAQEAINNSIGSPDSVKLSAQGDLTYFYKQEEDKKKGYSKPVSTKKEKVKEKERPKTSGDQKTIRQLLGELYGDKDFLEKLLGDPALTGGQNSMNRDIKCKVEDGLDFLDSRADFWRQQKPMYARKRDREKQRQSAKSRQRDPTDYLLRCLEEIDEDQVKERYDESLTKAKKTLRIVENMSEDQLQNKAELLANIHSQIGNAYLELGKYSLSLEHHEEDLRIANSFSLEDAKSRALDNLGRVYARKGNFEKAIEVWEEKLPMSKSPLESTWLYHEIGRCYLELNKYQDARDFGEKSLAAARDAEDDGWQLHASVLVAQSEVKLNDLQAACDSFERSLELAKRLGDRAAEDAITKALQEVNNKIVKGVKEGDDRDDDDRGSYKGRDDEPESAIDKMKSPAGGMKSPSSRQSAASPAKRSVSIKEPSPSGRDSRATPKVESPRQEQASPEAKPVTEESPPLQSPTPSGKKSAEPTESPTKSKASKNPSRASGQPDEEPTQGDKPLTKNRKSAGSRKSKTPSPTQERKSPEAKGKVEEQEAS
ncbi:hypothetical protein FSP39_000037 [Pinctada imbricata]|uniref:Outer dynein arm-docking complex subunit 4 n=1 Tax=Pinctada imbricata TaxID=66713 RepID=A0AA89BUC3_PINIB|nr:hypothetical protein FSP39_000037 [Pinctada imbricata]